MLSSWWRASSSSTRLAGVFIVPLLLVSTLVVLSGSKSSNWIFNSSYYPSWSWTTSVLDSHHHLNNSGDGFVTAAELRKRRVGGAGDREKAVAGDYTRGAPPLVVGPPPLLARKGKTNVVINRNDSVLIPKTNNKGTHHVQPALVPIINKRLSNLRVLEAKLQQARSVIRNGSNAYGSLPDPDHVPTGPTYWNPSSFHRSYLEMEKQLKVYVYEEGEQPIFHNGPCGSIYSMEGNFIHMLETSEFRTKDPEKAQIFFLPFSVTSIVRFIFDKDASGDHWLPMKKTVKDYVELVAKRYPYWNRSLGSDHFMLSCHDWGPELSKSLPELYDNSIRALCNANTSEGFRPYKDVSIPEINLPGGRTDGLLGGPSASKRPVLAFFAGGVHGPIRPILLEHWENKDEDLQIHKYLPKGVSYAEMMRKSKFCICPSGYEVASPRMVESLYTGCVPVLVKDHYVPPFSDVLNWKSFAVEVSVEDIPNLKKILTGISTRQYIRLQRRGLLVRRHFEVNLPPKRYDVFHMTLHSIWLRRLNVRLHGVQDS